MRTLKELFSRWREMSESEFRMPPTCPEHREGSSQISDLSPRSIRAKALLDTSLALSRQRLFRAIAPSKASSKASYNQTTAFLRQGFTMTLLLIATTALSRAERIVSLSLASDEILLEMLPSCGGLSRLAAVSVLADDPQQSNLVASAKAIPNRVHSEPEALMTLKPDLVIAASFNSLPLLDLVKQKKIPILVLSQFANHGDIQKNILDIGKMIDCPDKAKKMAEAFSQRIRKVKDESKSYPVETAVLYSQDLMVMAGETLFDDFLTMNHLANAATKAGLKYWPVISAEALKEWNPDWLVIICEPEICPQKAKVLKEQPAWKNLQATRKNNFLFISSKELMSTSQYFGALLKRPAPRP